MKKALSNGCPRPHVEVVTSLTQQQREAVEAEGDVLVMAGAGTGKTHTLVERVLHFALRPERPVALDRFLIVTFTEAATAELQRRLREALTDRHEAQPEDPWVASQLACMEQTALGTLHGYCLRLMREHFHELGLDPAIRTLDEAEAERLGDQALRAVFEPFFEGSEVLDSAVRDVWTGPFRGDPRAAGAAVRRLHAAVRALEDPAGWVQRQEAFWSAVQPEAWLHQLLAELPVWARNWRERLAGSDPGSTGELNPPLARRLPILAELAGGCLGDDARGWAAGRLAILQEQELEAWPKGKKTVLRKPLESLFAEASALAAWLTVIPGGTDPLREDWEQCRERMRTVLELWRRFDAEFARRKRERSAVDFADQEQFALDLLGRGAAAGGTAVAAVERARFDLVLVDECQDLNAAQDAILRAVSRLSQPGARAGEAVVGNRFLVGDVKQSIYRFRFADPEIFQRYAHAWSEPGAMGRLLALNENFRSTGPVLEFVNGLFPWLMRAELGGVTFGPEAALQFGAPETRGLLLGGDPRVEIHVRQTGDQAADGRGDLEGDEEGNFEAGEEGDSGLDGMEAEAGLVALRLRQLHRDGLLVWDKQRGGFRPVRWSDMAVLLRSRQSHAEAFNRAFVAAGVPLQSGSGGYFDRLEIRDLRSLITLLDNPLQDVPLIGVLRSPWVGRMEVDHLAVIRMVRRRSDPSANLPEHWWTQLANFVEVGRDRVGLADEAPSGSGVDGNGTAVLSGAEVFTHPSTASSARSAWQLADAFLKRFAEWRRTAARGPLALAIEAAIDDTGFDAACRSGSEGVVANANVQRFLELARQFDRRQAGGPAAFLEWLSALEAAEAVSMAAAGGADAVSLLTVHRSKGLEFPVVAVAALGGRFNERDLHDGPWMLDHELGLAPRVYPAVGRSYPGPSLWLASRRQRREMLGEEIRLLYVALTRAVDRLLLFGTASAKRMEAWRCRDAARQAPLPVAELESAKCPLQWIVRALTQWTGASGICGPGGMTTSFQWRIWSESECLKELLASRQEQSTELAASVAPVAEVLAAVVPIYPHQAATREPAKATVTGLRKRRQLEVAEEAGPLLMRRSGRLCPLGEADGPLAVAAAPVNVSAVERGVLHHRFLEQVALEQTASPDALTADLERLVRAGSFSAAEASLLDLVALARFWTGPLGDEIRRCPGAVRRELPFTLRLAVSDLLRLGFHVAPGLDAYEFVVVQGVMDLVWLGSDSAWVLDFKTDRVPDDASLIGKAAQYKPQLALYALAVERLFGVKVTAGWLHFLASGAEINVLESLKSVALPE